MGTSSRLMICLRDLSCLRFAAGDVDLGSSLLVTEAVFFDLHRREVGNKLVAQEIVHLSERSLASCPPRMQTWLEKPALPLQLGIQPVIDRREERVAADLTQRHE